MDRRKFFKEIKDRVYPENEELTTPKGGETAGDLFSLMSGDIVEEETKISRKEFLALLGGAIIASSIPSSLQAQTREYPPKGINQEKNPGEKSDQRAEENQNNQEEGSKESVNIELNEYFVTALENSGVIIIKSIFEKIFDYYKIKHGNPPQVRDKIIEDLRTQPLKTILLTCGAGPLVEEAFYRLLPSYLIDKKLKENNGNFWEIGIPVAALFAGTHNFYTDKEGGPHFATDRIPITQFIGGLFYWYLQREKGYSHATLAHSMSNLFKATTMASTPTSSKNK